MALDACFVCSTVSHGSLPALGTVCMPSGKSIAEQLCRGLEGCLLPLMPEHVACISCQQTASHLDQLWAEAEMLQRALSDKFLRAYEQVDISTMILNDDPVASEAIIFPSSSQLSPLPEAVDNLTLMSAALVDEDSRHASLDSFCASSSDMPSPATVEGLLSPPSEAAPYPQPDSDVSLAAESWAPYDLRCQSALKPQSSSSAAESDPSLIEGAVGSEVSQFPESVLAPVLQAADPSATDNTLDSTPQQSPEPAPRAAGRAVRTGPKTCPHCGRTYQRWRDLDTHLSVHTGSLPHQCAECGRQFASHRRLADHQRGHAEGWSCQICDKVFRHPSSLQHHRRQHEQPTPASVCPICSRSLSSAAQLRAHLRTHTDERPYQCDACPLAFRQASTLRVHARLHTGERPFQCDTCGRGFRGRAAFMTHLQGHGAVAARFACDTCGKAFFYRSKMEQHRATHGGHQTACCEQCGLTFSSVAALRRHQVTHSSQRPHACPVCGRRFKEAGVLQKHQRQMHAADAAHVCSVCGKRCAGPYKLSEHMRTHTGERPFACLLCPKSFTQAVHLSMHQRTHQRTETPAEFATV